MKFEKHLFISYAHIDNQTLSSEEQGWVSRFHVSLESLLSMRLGGKARIWRDTKLRGNDIFGDEIVDQFPETAVLVSIITPRYLRSEWCVKEVREFVEAALETGGVTVGNKARIFKVIKTPVASQEQLPHVMKGALGYQFFTLDEQERPIELDPAFGKELERDYLRKINAMAWDITEMLTRLDEDAADTLTRDEPMVPVAPKPSIYLAECSYDRREDRRELQKALTVEGYTVLPHDELPRLEADYVAEMDRDLERSKLSIHLIGQGYGLVPDGPSHKSGVVLQNECAVEKSKSHGLQRVIWLPEGTRSEQAQQQAFIEALHQDAEVRFGADVISGSLEALQATVIDTLKQIEKPKPTQPEAAEAEEEHRKMVYIICDEKDRKKTIPVRKFLKGQDFEVRIPLFQGDADVVQKAQQEDLSTCDAIIVFYGEGDEAWKRSVDNELKKIKGYRGEKPLLANYTYLAEPVNEDKEELIEFEEPNLINALDGFSEAEMDAFMQAVTQS